MIEGQFSLGRQTQYMNKVRKEWENRPPTQDSNPIYGENDNKNSCEDFFKSQDTQCSRQKRGLSQFCGPELDFLNVRRQQDRFSQYKEAE